MDILNNGIKNVDIDDIDNDDDFYEDVDDEDECNSIWLYIYFDYYILIIYFDIIF